MILKRRLIAFFIDYFIIILYAIFLWITGSLVFKLFNISTDITNPVRTQLIGFFTLTLPVFAYFFLSEKSSKRGSIGKRKLNLYIDDSHSKWRNGIFLRNILKFLPWEIAHTGVHWIMFYSNNASQTPQWVWMALIIPQVIIVFYLTSIFYYKGESSVYDMIAGTRIKPKEE